MNDEFGIDEQFDMLDGDGDSGYDYQIPKNIYYLINPADIPDDVREEALKFISENTFTANLKFNEDYDNEAGFLDLKITKTSNKLNFEYALFVIVLSYICKLMQTRNFKNDQVVLSEYEKLFDKVDYYLENFEELIKKETLNSRPFNNKRIEFNIEGNNFVTYTLNFKKYFLGGLCTNSMEKSFECLYILLKYYHEKFVNYYKLDEFYKTINLAFKTIRAMNLDISDTDALRIIPACYAYFMTKHIEFVKERDNIGDDLSVDIPNNDEMDSLNSVELNDKLSEKAVRPSPVRNFFICLLRYLFAFPLALLVLQLVWAIGYYIWKFWIFISQPLTQSLFRIELIEKIGVFIDNFLFASINSTICAIAFVATFYFMLPKNKARNILAWIFCVLYVLWDILTICFGTLNGFEIYSQVISILIVLYTTGALTSDNIEV